MTKSALTILFLTMFFIMLGFGIIIPHLAYYADNLGASPLQIGGLLAIYSAAQLIFAPMWGRLSDRKGRKPLILIGLVGNAAALILFGFSKTLVWAFIARALSGAWSAAVLPTVMAYVADVTTEKERGKGMASMGAAMGLGFILGPRHRRRTTSASYPILPCRYALGWDFRFCLHPVARVTEGCGSRRWWRRLGFPLGDIQLAIVTEPVNAAVPCRILLDFCFLRLRGDLPALYCGPMELWGKRDGADVRYYGVHRSPVAGKCSGKADQWVWGI